MILVQRIFAAVMAGAFVFVFIVPFALQRKEGWLAVAVVAVYVAYVGFNAWHYLRTRNLESR